MKQQALMLMVMLLVVVGMGAFVIYDITANNRLAQITEREDGKSNWNWEDNWNAETPIVNPDKPNEQLKQQIVADNYKDAIWKSGKMGMPIFVYFEADWCTWCKKMKSEVLTDAKVKRMLTHYIVVYVDTDKNRAVANKHGVASLPSYVITNVNEKKLKMDKGYMAVDKFAKWLDNPSMYKQPKVEKESEPEPPRVQPDDDDRRWPRFPRDRDRDRDDQPKRRPG